MSGRKELARSAYETAGQVRRLAGMSPAESICVFDFVHDRDVEIRFQNISSMEGLYYNDDVAKPLILVSSCRPRGRQAFNAAHEYGHHVFGHGSRVDEVVDSASARQWQPDEFLADCFAGYLLMPKLAVSAAFASRGWKLAECTPEPVFVVSGYMGVGYHTLITHMRHALEIISQQHFLKLKSVTPKKLKHDVIGGNQPGEVILLDKHWGNKAVDLCVGDCLLVPEGTSIDGTCLDFEIKTPSGLVYRAMKQGLDRALNDAEDWASHVRITRTNYEGLSQYRHFPEIDDE